MEINESYELIKKVKENLQKVIIGKEEVINQVLTALIAGGHILLEDIPGTGKTLLSKSLAKSIHATFSRIQFTPDLLPSDITGTNIYNQKEAQFSFIPGPAFCNVLLADEINRATPRTQSSLLECMEERQITVDGTTYSLETPFFVVATQNPIETAGTFPLPEAQLDRFMMKLSMGYPTKEEELLIMNRFLSDDPLATLSFVLTKEQLLEIQESVHQIYIHDAIKDYVITIAQATRAHHNITIGASPRASLSLLKASQAYALIQGRSYVLPDDIKSLVIPVLQHRMITLDHNTSNRSLPLTELLSTIPVPSEDFSR